jgi:hypothetical protein
MTTSIHSPSQELSKLQQLQPGQAARAVEVDGVGLFMKVQELEQYEDSLESLIHGSY